jgi:Ca2+-binding EF-hand superfamily protein
MIFFFLFQAIYNMLGSNLSNNELDTPAERTEKIFDKMDLNNDGVLTE